MKQINLTGNRRLTVRHSGGGAQSGNLAQGTRNHRSAFASVPKFVGPLTCGHTVRETTTEFCTVIKIDVRKISTRSATNAERDLFAIANFVL